MKLRTDENSLSYTDETQQDMFSFKDDIPAPTKPENPNVQPSASDLTEVFLQNGLSFNDDETTETISSNYNESPKSTTSDSSQNQEETVSLNVNSSIQESPVTPESQVKTFTLKDSSPIKETSATTNTNYHTAAVNPTTPEPSAFNPMTADTSNPQATEFYPGFDEPYVSTSTSSLKQDITFKEFYGSHCSLNIKKNINGAAIALYFCCALTFILSFVASALNIGSIGSIIDAIFLLGLALGIHIGKSRACAVIVLIYSILNCIYSLVATGRMGGYLIIMAGFYAVIYTFMAHKEYNEYINRI